MAAAGAALLALSVATPASAVGYVSLRTNSMDTGYTATFAGTGAYASLSGTFYSNGLTFTAKNSDAFGNTTGAAFQLFGFCVDVFHEIDLGDMYHGNGTGVGAGNGYGDVYQSNQTGAVPPAGYDPLRTDFATYNGTQTADDGTTGTTAYDLAGHPISAAQLHAITGLVDTGLWLHTNEASLNYADTEMRLAAIQAAIWAVEVGPGTIPNLTITVNGSTQYKNYFHDYSHGIYGTGNFANKADANDSFYVISDYQQGQYEPLNSALSGANGINQAFAIGWPLPGVPEPATWGLMIMGFGGVGAALRRRRQAPAFA